MSTGIFDRFDIPLFIFLLLRIFKVFVDYSTQVCPSCPLKYNLEKA